MGDLVILDAGYLIFALAALFALAAVFDLFGGRAAKRAAEDAASRLEAIDERLNEIEATLDGISDVLDVEGYYERTAELRERGVDV